MSKKYPYFSVRKLKPIENKTKMHYYRIDTVYECVLLYVNVIRLPRTVTAAVCHCYMTQEKGRLVRYLLAHYLSLITSGSLAPESNTL